MISDIELLDYIYQTARMGHDGIDAVMKYSGCRPLTDALRQQKAEYGELGASAVEMIRARGGCPEPLPMGAKMGLAPGQKSVCPALRLQNCGNDDHRQHQGRHQVHPAPPAVSGQGRTGDGSQQKAAGNGTE